PPLPSEPLRPEPSPPARSLRVPRPRSVSARKPAPVIHPSLNRQEEQSPNWISLTVPAGGLRRFAYLLLILAILPLVIHTISPRETLLQRLMHTAQAHPALLPKVNADEGPDRAELPER